MTNAASFPPPKGKPAKVRAERVHQLSTPRVFRLLRFVTALSLIGAGIVAAWLLSQAAEGVTTISQGTGQLQRLQLIRGDVLRADALATNGLAQVSEPAAQREAYSNHLTEAAQLTVEASDAQSLDQAELATINAALVRYAATMELARSTYPDNAASGLGYVETASRALRTQAVPALDRLIAANQGRVDAARSSDRLWALPIAAVPVLVTLLASVVLARRSRRLLNIGLLLALLASVALWQSTDSALTNATTAVDTARSGTLRTAISASHAYAAVSDARSAEGRVTLQPANLAAGEAQWKQQMARATKDVTAVTTGQGPLTAQLAAYTAAHNKLVALISAKRTGDAAKAAADTSATGVNATYAAFADNARRIADQASDATASDMAKRHDQLTTGALLALMLGLAGAVAGMIGIGARLKEYR